MIKKASPNDTDAILDVWLEASVIAHHFIDAAFWRSQVQNMREIYLPASAVYTCTDDAEIKGFYALYENNLAAIFVAPRYQGCGIGKQLLNHAKQQRTTLTLSVYKENESSYQFYLSQGFSVVKEQTDEHTGHPEYVMYFDG